MADPTSALKRRGESKFLSSMIGSLGSERKELSAKKPIEHSSIATTAKGSIMNSPEKPSLPALGSRSS